jgi:hypothetical protein
MLVGRLQAGKSVCWHRLHPSLSRAVVSLMRLAAAATAAAAASSAAFFCCCRARAASRHVQAWRDTIAAITPGVQQFETALLQPTKFSPWS